MSINIKDPETHRLARELADQTGETMTQAVREAIRERLNRVQGDKAKSLSKRLLEIGRDCASRLPEPWRSVDHAELLYDERGLPR